MFAPYSALPGCAASYTIDAWRRKAWIGGQGLTGGASAPTPTGPHRVTSACQQPAAGVRHAHHAWPPWQTPRRLGQPPARRTLYPPRLDNPTCLQLDAWGTTGQGRGPLPQSSIRFPVRGSTTHCIIRCQHRTLTLSTAQPITSPHPAANWYKRTGAPVRPEAADPPYRPVSRDRGAAST